MKTHDIWISAQDFINRFGDSAVDKAWGNARTADSDGNKEQAKGWKRVAEIIQVLENEQSH